MSLYTKLLPNAPEGTKYLTKSLFYEQVFTTFKPYAIYTLKDEDIEREVRLEEDGPLVTKVFPSLYLQYMKIDDPTEWEFANECFSGWGQWEELSKASFMVPFVTRWRKELDLRTRSKALARIKQEAKTNSKEALAASKYLIARGWEDKPSHGRGRPTKEEINKAANELANSSIQLDQDHKIVSSIISSKVIK